MPREPKGGESRSAYVSFCIKYFIDKGEYPNTEAGRKQAAGHCNGLYDQHKGENEMEKIVLCATIEPTEIQLGPSVSGDVTGVTMIVGNNTYNGKYFPVDELKKSVAKWDKIPIVLNHNEAVENVVGHLEDVKLVGTKLRAKPVIDNYEKSETARNYILEQRRIGKVSNVSIAAWYNPSFEEVNGNKNTLVARDLRPAHLGIVVHGACSPEDGCGIGLKKAEENNNATVTINVTLDEDVKKLALLEEINARKERLKK